MPLTVLCRLQAPTSLLTNMLQWSSVHARTQLTTHLSVLIMQLHSWLKSHSAGVVKNTFTSFPPRAYAFSAVGRVGNGGRVMRTAIVLLAPGRHWEVCFHSLWHAGTTPELALDPLFLDRAHSAPSLRPYLLLRDCWAPHLFSGNLTFYFLFLPWLRKTLVWGKHVSLHFPSRNFFNHKFPPFS